LVRINKTLSVCFKNYLYDLGCPDFCTKKATKLMANQVNAPFNTAGKVCFFISAHHVEETKKAMLPSYKKNLM